MRALIVHSRYLSGAASGENQVVDDEARLLREAGHSVVVHDPSPHATSKKELVRLAVNTVWSRSAVRKLHDLLEEHRPEVMHVHNVFPALSPAIYRLGKEVPIVQTLHNYRFHCLPGTYLRDGRPCESCRGRAPLPGVRYRCYQDSFVASAVLATSLSLHRTLDSFDNIRLYLAVSNFVAQKHVESGLPEARMRVKPNFAWPRPVREGAGDYFLYVGRLTPEKGVDTLLQALRGTGHRLLVAGNGPSDELLRKQAPDNVEFLGLVATDEVPGLMRGSRALLLPSRWYEGAPRGIIEAYATGIPVIASSIGAMVEMVRHELTGLLVKVDDVEAWRGAIDYVGEDQVSMRLGQGAFAAWQEAFSPVTAIHNIESFYDHLIGSQGR